MANTPETHTAETQALRNDLEQLRKDLARLSENAKQRSNSQVQAGISKACDRFRDIGSELESRPVTSVLAAFGVGLLLGKIFSR